MAVLYKADFHQELEQGGWQWLRGNSDDWQAEEGALHIRIRPGSLWGTEDTASNTLLRPLPAEAVEASVRVEFTPEVSFEQGGIILFHDTNTYIKLVKELVNEGLSVVLAVNREGEAEVAGQAAIQARAVELRLLLGEKEVIAQYREIEEPAGENNIEQAGWQSAGRIPALGHGQLQVGLLSHGGAPNGNNWAQYSEFQIL